MLIFAIVLVVLGLATKQPQRYWIFAGAALLTQVIVGALLAGGGTLEDPQGDGIVTQWVRGATNDGPAMGLYAIVVLALGWGVPLFLVYKGYVRKSARALA